MISKVLTGDDGASLAFSLHERFAGEYLEHLRSCADEAALDGFAST
jgi:hypothetical protein